MADFSSTLRMVLGAFSGRFTGRPDKSPIASFKALHEFVNTRSAYVMQKKLYDYVKTRMGTQYVRMFNDDAFIHSLNIARMHVYAACLSDLSVYAIAWTTHGSGLPGSVRREMALTCYERGIAANLEHAPDGRWAPDAIAAFTLRVNGADWEGEALDWTAFTRSPAALIRWAPIAEELKEFDRDIVENSINFAWRDIRVDLRNRLDAGAVREDWAAHHAAADAGTQRAPRKRAGTSQPPAADSPPSR